VPNQELSVSLLQCVTYRDYCYLMDGDSIAEVGNNASTFIIRDTETL
jgi:hypothetical protein